MISSLLLPEIASDSTQTVLPVMTILFAPTVIAASSSAPLIVTPSTLTSRSFVRVIVPSIIIVFSPVVAAASSFQ